MKKLMLILILLALSSNFVEASHFDFESDLIEIANVTAATTSEICVAQKVHLISYASTMHYQVNCKNEQFKSTSIITTAIIPFPYEWGKVARQFLNSLMNEKGYASVAKITEVTAIKNFRYGFNQPGTREVSLAFSDSVLIYSKSKQVRNFCGVLRSNSQTIGHAQKITVYDYVISCSQKELRNQLNGVSEAEFNVYMNKLGVKFNLSTEYLGIEQGGTLLVYEQQ
jgi:hypothetical protein